MFDNLIIYSSTDGHTKRICERISNFLNDGDQVKLVSLDEVTKLDLSNFKQIIIGASIRYGKHKNELYKFIEKNIHVLNIKNNAFFSVNAVARKSEKNTPIKNPYIQKFLKLSNWKPKYLGVFGGQIDYSRYSFFDKHIIRFIMWLTNGPTNLSGTYDFTNWKHVDNFAKEITSI